MVLLQFGVTINNNMSFTVKSHSLSAITPVRLVYKYNTEERLAGEYISLKGDFAYYKHEALTQFKDAALSRKTCLMLTDVKSIRNVLNKTDENFNIGEIAGTLYLKGRSNVITETNDVLYVGGTGRPVLITIVPVENNLVELRVNRTKYVEIDREYPYTARLSDEIVDITDIQFRRYEVDYSNGIISFKVKTPEGYRFLSYGIDNVVRAVGLEMNETVVNSYHFTAEYKTRPTLTYNFIPNEKEVKYYNDLLVQQHKTDVELRSTIDSESNLLITCPTAEIAKSSQVTVNIASLKTDYTPTGTFSPTI